MAVRKVETKDGARYRLRFYAGLDPDTKKRIYVTETFRTKKAADRQERKYADQKEGGALRVPSKESLATYLTGWLERVKKGSLRGRTFADYRGTLRRYLEDPPEGTPQVGRTRLDRLTPEAIQDLYYHLQEDQHLSARTVRSLHAVLRQGLAYAVRTGAATRNVADLVELPKIQKRKVEAMTVPEARRFLKASEADRYPALWAVLLTGGLRPGEALGLTWKDLDLDAGKIHVQRSLTRLGTGGDPWKLVEPKTDRSRRVVPLPPFVLRALRDHRKAQAAERLLVGAEYEDNDFIFATEFGKPLDGTNLYARNFNRIMAAAKLGKWEGEGKRRVFKPAYRMYDLRHTCATHLLQDGTNAKVVSERLGHASVAFTMDVYAASLEDLQEVAVEKQEALYAQA